MHIIRFQRQGVDHAEIGVQNREQVAVVDVASMADLLTEPLERIRELVENAEPIQDPIRLLAPIDGGMEVWANGVTYERSRDGRVEESNEPTVYDRVYEAERPELFFKSVAWRVVGHNESIGLRGDSRSDVAEPELALVLNQHAEIVGFTVCNDVTSRDLEGTNPLYLPQAKLFAGGCAIGPAIRPAWMVPHPTNLAIKVSVTRDRSVVWSDETSSSQLRREFDVLVQTLFSADVFPQGAILSTGTGLVPPLEFSLQDTDVVEIEIEDIGILRNQVVRGKEAWMADRLQIEAGVTA